jgi:TonB-linked SusC/RagA family outer membrane protein
MLINMKKFYQLCLCVTLLCLITVTAYAQKSVTGTVRDATGAPIPAVSVLIKGTQKGTNTDVNGKYTISAPEGSILVFRYLGYQLQEITLGASASVNVTLQEEKTSLNEVVVTALGVRREKKSLGYAVQEVKGETLVEAREPNLVNTLSGKVSGLQITRSSNGPAGSSKITLRGNNSLTGDNQPLIVVDGIPLNNFTGGISPSNGTLNNDFYNPARDMGNGLSDINPEDIESISVLKGPTASALYGSRAGNGVIMITTKSGKSQKGLGITVSSTLGVESIFATPKFQNEFGQGDNNIFENNASTSWGPKAEGQTVTNWNNQEQPLRIYDNLGNYTDRGISSNQSVALQQQVNATSVYTSFNKLDNKSIIPGAELHRVNLLARAVSKFGEGDRWTVDTKVQYTNSNAENRPSSGSNLNNVFSTLYTFPRSLDLTELRNSVDANGKMIWYDPTSTALNPYWAKDYNLNQDVRDRFVMNGSLKYKFNDWLDAEVKGGADKFTTTIETKVYAGSPSPARGSYTLSKETFTETNFSALVSAHKDNVFGKLGGAFSLGGNLMSQQDNILGASSGELVVPDLFSLTNGVNPASVSQVFTRKKINSIYGTAQLNWDGYLFVDGTFRNDWSSTLSPDNRSYFYPSVSVSYVISDMFTKMGKELPTWLSYAKVRASAASVGNDLGPYQLYNTYSIGKDANGNTTANRNNTLFDPNVRNELIKSYEAGAEMRFFKGRFGLDFAVYKSNATNQLINIPVDPLSGYSFKKVNAGNIQNTGIELTADANVLMSQDNGLNWNVTVNYSRNNNTVKSLTSDISQYVLGGYDDVKVLAVAGEKYGEIYGSKFLRVTDANSAYFGQNVKLGTQQASGLLGVTNTFNYKGFNLSVLVDGRFGGKIFSNTIAQMERSGTSNKTVVNGNRDNITAEGVILDPATNQYVVNNKSVTPQQYWTAIGTGNIGVTEANMYDASNIRIRNVNLSYNISQKILAKSFIQRAKIGVSCNNVWLITSHMNGIDPESVFAAGGNATGFESLSPPTTRTLSFNLTLGF